MRPILVLAAAILLAACQPTAPTSSSPLKTPQQYAADTDALLDKHIGNLVNACIAFAARGTPPSAAEFTAKGYQPGTLLGAQTFVLKLGSGLLDSKAITLAFLKRTKACNISLESVGGGVWLWSGWVGDKLSQAGFAKADGGTRRKILFRNGDLAIIMKGVQVNSQAVITLQKAR